MKQFSCLLAGISMIFALAACGNGNTKSESAITETTTAVQTTTTQPETTTEPSVEETTIYTPESEETQEVVSSGNESGIDKVAVYEYYNNLLMSPDNPEGWSEIGNEDMEFNSDEWKKAVEKWQQLCEEYDKNAMAETAEKFGITPEEVEQIFFSVITEKISEKPSVS